MTHDPGTDDFPVSRIGDSYHGSLHDLVLIDERILDLYWEQILDDSFAVRMLQVIQE